MNISSWLRSKIVTWLCIGESTTVEQHTHINFAAEACKVSNELGLGPGDTLVLLTDAVLSDTLLRRLKADCVMALKGKIVEDKIMILQGGLKMGVIHHNNVEDVKEITK